MSPRRKKASLPGRGLGRLSVRRVRPSGAGKSSAGFVLIAVLILVMLLSMVAISLMFRLKADETAAAATAGSEQAWAAAMSGVETAMSVVAKSAPGSTEWQDVPRLFKDREVYDDGVDRWFFTVYSAADSESRGELRYGLTDEAGKLDLNTATETNLLRLPRMTRPLADALLDFLDPDDTPRADGAEQDYYSALRSPYKVRNGPLVSLDELLLVRGFTVPLLYGEDANMNFQLDANENDGALSFPPDDSDSKLELGLRQYLTLDTYELDEDKDGVPRTNLNDPDDPLPAVELPPGLTNYITMLRSNGITLAHAADLLEARTKMKDASGREAEIESGVGKNELPVVLDLFTAKAENRLHGMINVNTASAAVLATVQGLDEALAESIVSARKGLSAEKRSTIGWLYTEGVIPADLFKKVAPYLTARSRQFSFRVAGYGLPSGRYRVLEVIIDCGEGKPVVRCLRDLTRYGMPFALEAEKEAIRG